MAGDAKSAGGQLPSKFTTSGSEARSEMTNWTISLLCVPSAIEQPTGVRATPETTSSSTRAAGISSFGGLKRRGVLLGVLIVRIANMVRLRVLHRLMFHNDMIVVISGTVLPVNQVFGPEWPNTGIAEGSPKDFCVSTLVLFLGIVLAKNQRNSAADARSFFIRAISNGVITLQLPRPFEETV